MEPGTQGTSPGPSPGVVVIGAGFAGLDVAKGLGARGIPVTVIDRQNHHLFQPLLYQVATAALSAIDIAEPIRSILRGLPSVSVVLGEVTAIDTDRKTVHLAGGHDLPYDYLVLAPGAVPAYFGHDAWRDVAPGLKTLEDARAIRTRLLLAFERAEQTEDPDERARLLTVAVIGGGPTGVEMSGAIAELSRHSLARDFRRIDPGSARILLVEGGPRLLNGFDERLSDYARRGLERLGVTVMTGQQVAHIGPGLLRIGSDDTAVGLVIWAAGVAASPLGRALKVPVGRGGRIVVTPCLAVPDRPGVFVLGDLAAFDTGDGRTLPGLAQVAQQQGRHLGASLGDHIRTGAPLRPFVFRDRGNTAIVGRHAAVYEFRRARWTGWFAWLFWAVVHIYLLVGFQQRLIVSIRWLWRYLTYQRGARIIAVPQEARRAGRADDTTSGSGRA